MVRFTAIPRSEYSAPAVRLASDENYCAGQITSPHGGLVI